MSDRGLPSDDFGREDDFLAAEYALGVLDAQPRRAAETRIDTDPAFAAEVESWQARFAPLLESIPETAPSDDLWERIDVALGPAVAAPRLTLVPSVSPAANSNWRGAGLAVLGALAASLVWAVVLVGLRPTAPPPKPVLIASLGPQSGRPWWVATIDPVRKSIRVTPAAAGPRDRRARELWLITAQGTPRPLGVFPADETASMPMPEPLLRDAQPRVTLAVSLEPAGGSPTGKPTGPVIATGQLAAI